MAKYLGMIVAFSVNIPRSVERIAASNVVALYSSTIIYRVMEEVRKRVIDLLPVVVEKKVVGEAEVLQLFDISIKTKKMMQVGGCRVTNGVVEKSSRGRVLRNGKIIHEGIHLRIFPIHCKIDMFLIQDHSIPSGKVKRIRSKSARVQNVVSVLPISKI